MYRIKSFTVNSDGYTVTICKGLYNKFVCNLYLGHGVLVHDISNPGVSAVVDDMFALSSVEIVQINFARLGYVYFALSHKSYNKVVHGCA